MTWVECQTWGESLEESGRDRAQIRQYGPREGQSETEEDDQETSALSIRRSGLMSLAIRNAWRSTDDHFQIVAPPEMLGSWVQEWGNFETPEREDRPTCNISRTR